MVNPPAPDHVSQTEVYLREGCDVCACDARARVWRYVFDRFEKKKTGVGDEAHAGDEAKGQKDDRPEQSVR